MLRRLGKLEKQDKLALRALLAICGSDGLCRIMRALGRSANVPKAYHEMRIQETLEQWSESSPPSGPAGPMHPPGQGALLD